MTKKIFIGLILIFLFTYAAFGQVNENSDESKFEPDRSDLTQALNSKAFQIQTGISYSQSDFDSSESNQLAIPFLIGRYGITNNFGIQIKSELDLTKYFRNENLISTNSDINYILIGFLYQLQQERRILFFDQLSFLLDNSIPLQSTTNFYSEMDFVFATNLSDRFALEYGVGLGYENNTDGYADLLFEIETYLTSNIYCELSYNGTIYFGRNAASSQNSIGLELDFLSLNDYQINFNCSKMIDSNYWFISGTFVYTFQD